MNSEIVRLLIEHGAKVNARDVWEHRTPLYFAHEPDVIEELTKAGGTK
jgi:ankyrin repeat protein